MTTLDLAKPQHVEALRWAGAMPGTERSHWLTAWNQSPLTQRQVDALRAFTDPALAAELVRELLERHGIRLCGYGYDAGQVRVFLVPVYGAEGAHIADKVGIWVVGDEFPLGPLEGPLNIPRLSLALLDATSAEEAMTVVREVGR